MNPIILIPARMASTRLPGKPMALIASEPMIVRMWQIATESGASEVAVACDGEEIAGTITQAGGRAVITDPNLPSGSDRIFAALQQIDPQKKYDVVVNLQGDMPTLDPALIVRAIHFLRDSKADIATLAAKMTDEGEIADPAVVKVAIGKNGEALSFSRTASGNGPFYHHIGLYAYTRDALEKFVSLPQSPLEKKEKLEQLRAMEAGMKIVVAVVGTVPLGVDTPELLEKARKLINDER